MDWRHEAACREVDPELFFPIGNTGPALLQIEEAKQVCRRCSVMDECLRWAIDSGQDAGVWGGMSEDERRAFKRRTIRLRARAHVLPAPGYGSVVTSPAGNPGYATRIRQGDRRTPRCRHPAGARSAADRPAR
jgi:WhiB family transcriptional regulator, redox-sensing transcriptional regulator